MLDFHLREDCSSVGGHKSLAKVVNNHLVHTLRAKRSTVKLSKCLASKCIANNDLFNTRKMLGALLEQVRLPRSHIAIKVTRYEKSNFIYDVVNHMTQKPS
jgi:hypothetical protein